MDNICLVTTLAPSPPYRQVATQAETEDRDLLARGVQNGDGRIRFLTAATEKLETLKRSILHGRTADQIATMNW